jgi:hypothetical protein
LALEILRDLWAGLAGGRILRDLWAGLAVDQIPRDLSAVSADAATAAGCCDSRHGELGVSPLSKACATKRGAAVHLSGESIQDAEANLKIAVDRR